MESKLQDKEKQIEALIKKQEQFEQLIQSLIFRSNQAKHQDILESIVPYVHLMGNSKNTSEIKL